jgi:hypothetical protein
MRQAVYNIKDTYYGNTKKVVIFTMPYDVTGATAELVVKNKLGATLKTYTVGNGLTLAPTYDIELDEHIVTIPVGSNDYELTVTFATGRVYSFVGGKWNIL